ncbi:uncharacterized protein LOC125512139 [Triticum urartu]|uniref:uncharacterized protein LOC125512139 n=1 Tax=Triticum urartu TaxID=4572 RepID=UPI002042BEC6|nr:uncharacterized protein LOC125512139 [Triticum urartu]
MLLERGPPKKRRKKKSAIQDPEAAMVVACASTTAPVMVYPSRSIKGSKEPKHASGEQKEKSKKSAPRKGKGKAAKEKIASRVVAIGEQTPKGKEKCSEVAPHDSPAMGTRSKRTSHSPAMSTRSKRAPVRLDL